MGCKIFQKPLRSLQLHNSDLHFLKPGRLSETIVFFTIGQLRSALVGVRPTGGKERPGNGFQHSWFLQSGNSDLRTGERERPGAGFQDHCQKPLGSLLLDNSDLHVWSQEARRSGAFAHTDKLRSVRAVIHFVARMRPGPPESARRSQETTGDATTQRKATKQGKAHDAR